MHRPVRTRLIMPVRARRLEAPRVRPEMAATETAQRLDSDIAQADARAPDAVPPDVIRMNSSVSAVDESAGGKTMPRAVYPHGADAGPARVPVFAPVGGARPGACAGDAIDGPLSGGRQPRLRVTGAHCRPDAAGRPG